jgi:hypothetical protein
MIATSQKSQELTGSGAPQFDDIVCVGFVFSGALDRNNYRLGLHFPSGVRTPAQVSRTCW